MRMVITILDLASVRPVASSSAMILLLVMAGAGDGALVSTLRGSSVDEAREAEPLGYYEVLTAPPRPLHGRPAGPPPGWTAFGAAATGIVREVPSYLRWTMKPDLDLRWNGTVFRTNHLGLRPP